MFVWHLDALKINKIFEFILYRTHKHGAYACSVYNKRNLESTIDSNV